MASVKNTSRHKRKYDNREARTTRNKAIRQKRHERRLARFAERMEALMGKRVSYGSGVGTVTDILYPEGKGPKRILVLVDEKTGGEFHRLRKRVKPL